ncbi:hypothetical protein NEFER01_0678 [Nematocida sp. LUAm1]|nr:hypothetical protein NEFER02_0917 [Nematocida sp. LUAm2]KAI5177428.1 hypothetical protein NEFER01_0678 [Nematocida sp. LUAm1]
MFEGFTIRTERGENSSFFSEQNFSLRRFLSLDPTSTLYAEEFFIWILITLSLLLLQYTYSSVKEYLLKKVSKKQVLPEKEEIPWNDARPA